MVFIIFMTAIFPLMLGNELYGNITKFRFTSFVVSTCIYAGVCFVILCVVLISGEERKRRFNNEIKLKLSMPQIIMLAYMAWGIITALCSPCEFNQVFWGLSRYEGLCSLLLYGLIFVLISFWGEYKSLYIYIISISAGIISIIGILQCSGVNLLYTNGDSFSNLPFLSTLGNIDLVSGYGAMIIPILFCFFVFSKDNKRYIPLVSSLLLFYVQVFCDVDSGKIGLLAAFLLSLPFLMDERRKISNSFMGFAALGITYALAGRSFLGLAFAILMLLIYVFVSKKCSFLDKIEPQKIRKIIAITLLAIIVIVLIFVFFYNGQITIISEAKDLLHGKLEDSAGTFRGYIWKSSFKVAISQPITGSGPGTFAAAFWQYQDGWKEYFPDQIVDFAHNDFLQIAVCQGIMGLIIYLAFIASVVYRVFKNINRCPEIAILAAGVCGYLAHSFFSFSIAIITPIFWVLMGMLDKMIEQIPTKQKK